MCLDKIFILIHSRNCCEGRRNRGAGPSRIGYFRKFAKSLFSFFFGPPRYGFSAFPQMFANRRFFQSFAAQHTHSSAIAKVLTALPTKLKNHQIGQKFGGTSRCRKSSFQVAFNLLLHGTSRTINLSFGYIPDPSQGSWK